MASSQVEIALSSPFGCVLKKYNRRDRTTAFQTDVRNFVRDHLNNNIKSSSPPSRDHDENNNKKIKKNVENIRLLSTTNNNNKDVRERDETCSRVAKRSRARGPRLIDTETDLSSENNNLGSPCTASSNRGGASSLVQIWERRLSLSNNNYNNETEESSSSSSSCAESLSLSYPDSTSDSGGGSTSGCSSPTKSTTQKTETETETQTQGEEGEAESSVRVADIIRRLKSHVVDDENGGNNGAMMGSSSSKSLTRSVTLSRVRVRAGTEQTTEQHKSFLQVLGSPRVRGRRAFNDLLNQMERDRNGELSRLAQRAPVSKFAQRGRIQSLLRLRLLQRRQAVYDTQESTTSSSSQLNRNPQGSSIMHLRERFNRRIENESRSPEISSPRSSCPSPLGEEHPHNNTQTIHHAQNQKPLVTVKSLPNHVREEDVVVIQDPSSKTCLDAQKVDHQNSLENEETTTCINDSVVDHPNANEIENKAEEEKAEHEYDSSDNVNMIGDESEAIHYVKETINYGLEEVEEEEEKASEQQQYNDDENNYEEEEIEVEDSDQQQYYNETYFDWISQISRPRSYWEDRRQAWYREMLDNTSASDKRPEIRQLLQQKTVSNFLSGDFRERMDKMIQSHIGTQTQLASSSLEDEEDYCVKMDQLIQFLQQNLRLAHNLQEESDKGGIIHEEKKEVEEEVVVVEKVKVEEEVKEVKVNEEEEQQEEIVEEEVKVDEEEEEEEEEENEGCMINEEEVMSDDYYINQSSPSPSTDIPNYSSSPDMSTWSFRDNIIINEGNDGVESSSSTHEPKYSHHPSPSQSPYQESHHSHHPSQSPYQESHQSSSSSAINCHANIEMEIIYDLRGRMEQLYQEMNEIRKSIQSCMDMMVLQQQTTKPEVNTVEEKKTPAKKPKKGHCSICYEKKVDSVFYRCGHMCACVKCANELQWKSGKCPICRAPIVDVVRVHVDT